MNQVTRVMLYLQNEVGIEKRYQERLLAVGLLFLCLCNMVVRTKWRSSDFVTCLAIIFAEMIFDNPRKVFQNIANQLHVIVPSAVKGFKIYTIFRWFMFPACLLLSWPFSSYPTWFKILGAFSGPLWWIYFTYVAVDVYPMTGPTFKERLQASLRNPLPA